MKLIIQKEKDGSVFAYMENEKHYKTVQNKTVKDGGRKDLDRHNNEELNEECCLDFYDTGYFVFNVKGEK
jgi:hypothetical protein